MKHYIERTCTEVGRNKCVRLSTCRETDAYVLLGGPGAGKTRSFQEEARQTKGGLYLPAHDFVELSPQSAWRDSTIFIDGLDELRASSPSPEPLGRIRARLDELGRPRFRLSCRDMDWSDTLDAGDLVKVSSDGLIKVLKLTPLSDSEVGEFLGALGQAPDAFTDRAQEDGNAPLLRNPLSLKLLVRAVAGGQRPPSRKQTFEASCQSLLGEHNERHAHARRNEAFALDERLDAAEQLCAGALLAGKRGYVVAGTEAGAHWIAIEDMPAADRGLFDAVLRTRLFESPADGHFAPLHHHIAEFLAGKHLAKRVACGLSTHRATALMTGFDGGVVTPLRGVWAWFAAHSNVARADLIDRDPLGTVLYGDVKQFSVADKERLIDRVCQRSQEVRHLPLDHWHSPRWADLATADAEDLIRGVFSTAPRSERHQRLALALTDAPDRRTFPRLRSLLLSVIRKEGLWDDTRLTALRHLTSQFRDAPTFADDLDGLLKAIVAGELADHDDELTGRLLCQLYPHRWSLADAKRCLHAPQQGALFGYYRHFWTTVVRDNAVEADKEKAAELVAEFERLADKVAGEREIIAARDLP